MLARTLVPRLVVFAALCAALGVGSALAVDSLAAPMDQASTPNPMWTTSDALAHPDCVSARTWPQGRVAGAVVVVDAAAGSTERIGFGRAWALNHDASAANDVWVVGVCP